MTNNRSRLAAVLLLLLATAGVDAQSLDHRINAYRRATTFQSKLEMMKEILRAEDSPELLTFLREAFDDATGAREARLNTREATAKDELKRLIVVRLGEMKAADMAPKLYKLYVEEPGYLVKGAALQAIGRVGAREYAATIADILDKLNVGPVGGVAGEAVALGAIAALAELRDPVGYPPVFFASIGRYSVGVRKRAEEALAAILSDPTEALNRIVEREPSLELRRRALVAETASSAPTEKKIEMAVTALKEAAEQQTRNEVQLRDQIWLQTTALTVR